MGHRIRVQRKGRSPNYNAHRKGRKGPAKLRPLDTHEKNGYICGTVVKLIHDRGRGAPLAKIRFPLLNSAGAMEDKIKKAKGLQTITIVAVEGIQEGQRVFFGDRASLEIGNCLPIGKMPEGTIISNIEEKPGDKGRLAKQSGNYATIVGHNVEKGGTENESTQIKLPSGVKKTLKSNCRAIVGLVAGGGRCEKPLMKAGNAFHKAKAGHKNWPIVRGVAMNAVDHPHGGGNHQHVGRSTCVKRNAPPGQKVGLIGARRTGRLRGSRMIKTE
eukprot:GAHX01000001.1.p1 GENE.GAHX01000001.1~~GAHX01000001.1.p1  ORF type:complete len:281 (+),score=46.45 GAHX01000001.1:30-845(+)